MANTVMMDGKQKEVAECIRKFSGSRMVSMKRIPLVDGHSSVVLSLSEDELNGEVTVVVDPFGEYQEADESNNTRTIASAGTSPIEEISIESASVCIRLSIPAAERVNMDETIPIFI